MRLNPTNFRVFGPDETTSNKLQAVYEASKKTWLLQRLPEDDQGGELAPDGRVMEMLSEHTLEGWLEGYTLTGRHGFFSTYEAFVHVIDSMVGQHAKWLEKCRELPWRKPVPSLNILITSTVWRQDHNGFTHQDPGFLDIVANKSAHVVRVYLPPDVNSLLSVADHCLRSRNYVNVIVCDKQLHLQYLDMKAAITHCTKGLGIWDWASNDDGQEPDVVLACAGDIPTQEALAATHMLREEFADLKIRFVNVVDLFKLVPESEHPHGMSDRAFDSIFTKDKPIIFNFHGYPWLIHRLAYRRTNHKNLHVRGYKEKGKHQHAAGASHRQQHRPLQHRDGCDRPRAPAACRRGARPRTLPRRADRLPELRPRTRHGSARCRGLALAVLIGSIHRAAGTPQHAGAVPARIGSPTSAALTGSAGNSTATSAARLPTAILPNSSA
jgi:xylulose-5-phosphate/fructose-6-phosphate phosphoketolase